MHSWGICTYLTLLLTFEREKCEFSSLSALVEIKPPKARRIWIILYSRQLNFNMEGIEAAFISYDVMCQWSVHMMDGEGEWQQLSRYS
jgi:hypothetical protein